jgi:hypothetical protein
MIYAGLKELGALPEKKHDSRIWRKGISRTLSVSQLLQWLSVCESSMLSKLTLKCS